MKCKVDGCNRDARYKEKQLCQMHYFRVMRNGITDTLPKSRNYRVQTPQGYQWIYKPEHVLSHKSSGYVAEHRYLIYEKYGTDLPPCEICGKATDWETCHIDHKDNDPTNNDIGNLRPLCRGCNTFRDYPEQHTIKGRYSVSCNGKTMTPTEWSRQPGVMVNGSTIRKRLAHGMSEFDAIYSEKKTHNGNPKIDKRQKKTAAKYERSNAIVVTIEGVTMTASEWSRHPQCKVTVETIVNRIKAGKDHSESVFGAPKTGKYAKTKELNK